MWGVRKLFSKDHTMPWSGHFIHSSKVASWLKLADFELESQTASLFSPPVTKPDLYKKFTFLETIGSK